MANIPDSVLEKIPQWGFLSKPREFPFGIDPDSGVVQSAGEGLECYVGWTLVALDGRRYTREIFESKNMGVFQFYCRIVGKIASIKLAVGEATGVTLDHRGAVTHVDKDSEASRKGVKQGWFFLTINGQPFQSWNQDRAKPSDMEWDVLAWATTPLRVTIQGCTHLGHSINNLPNPVCFCKVREYPGCRLPTYARFVTNPIPETNDPQWNFEGHLWGYHAGCNLEFLVCHAPPNTRLREPISHFDLLGPYITNYIGSGRIELRSSKGFQARLSIQVDQLLPPDPDPVRNIAEIVDHVSSGLDLRLPADEIIERTRDKLHHDGGTVFWSHIVVPVAAHGSHLIYAPDDVAWHLVFKLYGFSKKWCGTRNRDAARKRCKCEGVGRQLKDRTCVILTLPVALYVFYTHAAAITCFMQNTFLGWAYQNRGMGLFARLVSISLMMVVRLVASNILPFTSPVFAFLIAKSQPEGQEGLGTVYLLLCSMPAGAVVPLFDKLFEEVYAKFHPDSSHLTVTLKQGSERLTMDTDVTITPDNKRITVKSVECRLLQDCNPAVRVGDRIVAVNDLTNPDAMKDEIVGTATTLNLQLRRTQPFLFTHYASVFTDHLPFSFWVRQFFMEPAFAAARIAGSGDVSAAAAAVLAGHFMIWSGAPTTMHQRKFLPDWLTCILIQPLGLFEDVAVVLATWAGATAQSQKQAQIALYIFMLFMNVVQYFSTKRQKELEEEARNVTSEKPKPELSTAAGQRSPRQTGGSPRKKDEDVEYLRGEDSSQKTAFMSRWRHIAVAVLTIFVIIYTSAQDVGQAPMTTTTTTTTSPQHAPLCKSEHTNVKAVMGTVVVVSGEAVAFSLVAKVFAYFLWWIMTKRTAASREGCIRNQVASSDDATTPLLGSV